ncbi:MAG: polysaccharide pyruvyl transferase family protein [Lachnospiraceae bacterium]|nr:polysaccharide pyruvyl transferase family protein [Lachnospiraceae bacterium]
MDVLLFDTAIGTFNRGDDIILESTEKCLEPLLSKSYVMRFGTHINNLNLYHYLRNSKKVRYADNCDYKFILGTNLLTNDILRSIGQWSVGPLSKRLYRNSIMVGVGITKSGKSPTFYTKAFYKSILRKDIFHSVRDEESKQMLEAIEGVKAINTGCPTLWGFNQEVCSSIPVKKSCNAVFTLSGQKKYQNPERDQMLVSIVEQNYDKLYFWVQTYEDEGYFHTLKHTKDVHFIYSLKDYANVCENGRVDYVGTRLHGGIFAMQHGVRSVIVEIDHRAKGFREINHINTIERDKLECLPELINGNIKTEIILREKEIKEWISQFC